MAYKTRKELLKENEELHQQVDTYHRAYENIIIIQESIVKAIKQIKSAKKKAKKEGKDDTIIMLDGYLKCLYKMSSWINMQEDKGK